MNNACVLRADKLIYIIYIPGIYTVEQKIESCYDGIDCHCVVLGTLDVGSVLINAVIKADDLSCLVAHACTKFVSLEPSVI